MTFFILFACATKSSKTESLIDSPQERVSHIQVTELENGDILQQIDLDQDGQTDVWNTLHPRTNSSPILIKQVLDINHDGMGDICSQIHVCCHLYWFGVSIMDHRCIAARIVHKI